MKRTLILALLILCMAIGNTQTAKAQIPVVSLLSSVVKKVITSLDLKVQQLQNQTIALQNAEAFFNRACSFAGEKISC